MLVSAMRARAPGISDAPPPSEDDEAPDEGEGGSNEAGADAAAEEEVGRWAVVLAVVLQS